MAAANSTRQRLRGVDETTAISKSRTGSSDRGTRTDEDDKAKPSAVPGVAKTLSLVVVSFVAGVFASPHLNSLAGMQMSTPSRAMSAAGVDPEQSTNVSLTGPKTHWDARRNSIPQSIEVAPSTTNTKTIIHFDFPTKHKVRAHAHCKADGYADFKKVWRDEVLDLNSGVPSARNMALTSTYPVDVGAKVSLVIPYFERELEAHPSDAVVVC